MTASWLQIRLSVRSLSPCVRGHVTWCDPICTAGNGPLVPNWRAANPRGRASVPTGLQVRILQTVNSVASTCPAACVCLVMTKCELLYIGYDVIVVIVFTYFVIYRNQKCNWCAGALAIFGEGGWFPDTRKVRVPQHFATHFSVLWPRGLRRPLAGVVGSDPAGGMDVVSVVLSRRGFCVGWSLVLRCPTEYLRGGPGPLGAAAPHLPVSTVVGRGNGMPSASPCSWSASCLFVESTGVLVHRPAVVLPPSRLSSDPAHSQHLLHYKHQYRLYLQPSASKFLRFTFRHRWPNVLHFVVVWQPCMAQAVRLRVRSQARSSKWHWGIPRPAAIRPVSITPLCSLFIISLQQ